MSQVWKASRFGQVGTLIIVAIVTVYAFIVGGPVAGLVVLVLGAVIAWLFVFWPAVIVTETEVIVRNPWGVQRVPLGDIVGTGGAYAGLSIQRRSGGTVAAWAVQKSNAAKWSGKASRADEAAAAVMAAARRAPVENTP
jgi:hypothetical protein